MPYIAIKSFPKDEATKKLVVEKINDLFLEVWGCPQEAVTIGIEEVAPADWQAQVYQKDIAPQKDAMWILAGQKQY